MTRACFRRLRTSPASLRYLVFLVCGALATSPTAGRAQGVMCIAAHCYSGTVTWTTQVHGAGDQPFESTASVTATIDYPRVSCGGSYNFHQTYEAGSRTESRTISGAGTFHFERESADSFSMLVECPPGQGHVHRTGTRPQPWSKDEAVTGPGGTYGIETAAFVGPLPEDQSRLSGTVTEEPPDVDPANRVTGSMTITWNLTSKPESLRVQVEIDGPRCGCVRAEGGGEPLHFTAHASAAGGTFGQFDVQPAGQPPRVVANDGGTTPRLELAPSRETGAVTLAIAYTKGGRSYAADPVTVSFCVQDSVQLAGGERDLAFDASDPGRLEVRASSRAWYNGAEISPELSWSLEAILKPTQREPEEATGATVALAYAHLPATNGQFGEKTLTVRVDKADCQCHRTGTLRAFFAPEATNHPALEGSTEVTPNWFYYWMQTAAAQSGAVERSRVKYSQSASAGHFTDPTEVAALYDETVDLVLIRSPTFTSPCRGRVDRATKQPTGVQSKGIDCFAEVLRHEWQHRTDWKNWWPHGYIILADPDLDGVPMSVENAEPGCRNLGPDSQMSCRDRPFADVTDREIYAYYVGWTWPIGSADREDWSCGARGKQWQGGDCPQ